MLAKILRSSKGSYSLEQVSLIEPESVQQAPTFLENKQKLVEWLVSKVFPNENPKVTGSPAFNLHSELIKNFNAKDKASANTALAQFAEQEQTMSHFSFDICENNGSEHVYHRVYYSPTKSENDLMTLGKIATPLQ